MMVITVRWRGGSTEFSSILVDERHSQRAIQALREADKEGKFDFIGPFSADSFQTALDYVKAEQAPRRFGFSK